MDKTIITAFLIIAGVISAVFMFNSVYPAVVESSNILVSMESRIDERAQSQIEIIHAVADGTVTSTAMVWVKNIGSTSIRAVERCDVFFGPEGNFSRIPYGSGANYWTYTIENDTDWKPTATLKITIDMSENLVNGERYYVKVTLPNGVADQLYFAHAGL